MSAPHSPAPASTARRSPHPPAETDEPLDLATYHHARTRLGMPAAEALAWCRYYAPVNRDARELLGAVGFTDDGRYYAPANRDARELSGAVGFYADDGRYYSLTGIDGTRYTTRAQAIEAQRRLDEAHGERLAAREEVTK